MERIFNHLSEMKQFFKDQMKDDVWTVSDVKDLRVLSVPDAPICANSLPPYDDPEDNIRIKYASTDDICKAMEGTRLLLSYRDENKNMMTLPIKECAFDTLLRRACIDGTAMRKHSPEKVAIILNWSLSLWQKKGIVLKREGEVFAVHSADEYKVLPQYKLIDEIDKYTDSQFGGCDVKVAVTTDTKTLLRLSFKDNTSLLDRVRKVMSNCGVASFKNASPILVFTTSDTSVAGANLYPYIRSSDDVYMRIGDPLLLRHGRNNTMDDFVSNLSNIYKMFSDSAENMEKLAKQKLYYPEDVLRKLAGKVGIAAGAVSRYIEEEFIPGVTYTGYDIYVALWHIVPTIQRSLENIVSLEENIARLQKVDFTMYDSPIMN